MTGLSVLVDASEYGRYDPVNNTVNAYATISGAVAGDTLTGNLVRLDGYGSVLAVSVTLAAGQSSQLLSFPLSSCLDADGNYIARAGSYQVQLTGSNGSGTVTANSPVFAVSLITVSELTNTWLQGVPLFNQGMIGPVQQPQAVTGVTLAVPSHHLKGPFVLQFTAGSPSTLSWDGGAAVPVPAAPGQIVLPNAQNNDHVVAAVSPVLLPASSAAETIYVDDIALGSSFIQSQLRYAQGFIEGFCYFFCEPTYVATDPNTLAQGPETSVFTGWADEIAIPQTYYRPKDFMRWMSIVLPYNRLLKVHNLTGYFNSTLTLEITLDWIVWNETNAETELVPSNGAVVTWQFYESAMLQFLFIYNSIPSFWHYWLTCGMRDLYGERQVIREAIAKKAAIDIITQAGLAYSAGRRRFTTERDKVRSDTWLEDGTPGAALANEYRRWLFGPGGDGANGYLRKIKNRWIGPQFVVV